MMMLEALVNVNIRTASKGPMIANHVDLAQLVAFWVHHGLGTISLRDSPHPTAPLNLALIHGLFLILLAGSSKSRVLRRLETLRRRLSTMFGTSESDSPRARVPKCSGKVVTEAGLKMDTRNQRLPNDK